MIRCYIANKRHLWGRVVFTRESFVKLYSSLFFPLLFSHPFVFEPILPILTPSPPPPPPRTLTTGTENCPVGAVKETQPELKRKRIKEDGSSASAERAGAGNPAREANRVVGHGNIDSREDCVKGEGDPGVSTNMEGGIDESLGEGDSGGAGGEDTESDGEAARPRKKLAK